jgi:hypothetical protein
MPNNSKSLRNLTALDRFVALRANELGKSAWLYVRTVVLCKAMFAKEKNHALPHHNRAAVG